MTLGVDVVNISEALKPPRIWMKDVAEDVWKIGMQALRVVQ